MKEIQANIWMMHGGGNFVVVPTNGFVKNDGTLVMGRGIARDAARIFKDLPAMLGEMVRTRGNRSFLVSQHRIISYPVKVNWWDTASPALIAQSFIGLVALLPSIPEDKMVWMPRVGCGNGGLDWETDVKPVLDKLWHLTCDRVGIVTWDEVGK